MNEERAKYMIVIRKRQSLQDHIEQLMTILWILLLGMVT